MRYKGMQNARMDNHRLDRGRPDMVGRDNVQLGSGSRLGRVINCAHRYRTTVAVKHAFVGCVADCRLPSGHERNLSVWFRMRGLAIHKDRRPISCVIQTFASTRRTLRPRRA
jgi:hypothetical protein